ncbi:Biogenesis of lysosome-related organelles complex-1, subunit 2 like protein [Aduncisulcus paluster]|uniref:Biogenesis of lysosome-related organelles complex-1, subunit 2 like protein n=1 Tax=Aduncisulcus paluster TaxID=2918883 RepID=A0ABQ5K467_9EUKA|nr:Biogenesis of lysosome-related organelles complex-1, subunit 2 like protein [Aduncisulcus paluster]
MSTPKVPSLTHWAKSAMDTSTEYLKAEAQVPVKELQTLQKINKHLTDQYKDVDTMLEHCTSTTSRAQAAAKEIEEFCQSLVKIEDGLASMEQVVEELDQFTKVLEDNIDHDTRK